MLKNIRILIKKIWNKIIKGEGSLRFEIYKDKRNEWRWVLISKNNKKVATSGEGFKTKQMCKKSISLLKRDIIIAKIIEVIN